MTTSDSEAFRDHGPSHDRILQVMALLVIAGALFTAVIASPRFGIGFLVGGILSLLNYYWLKVTLRKFFEKTVEGEVRGMMGAQFILRYFLIGAVVLVVYLTGVVPIISVLLGLAGFALAVVIEGILNIFRPVKV